MHSEPACSEQCLSVLWSQREYQLLDILGKGAFGEAFKARHLPTGRLVCVKTLELPAGGHNKEEALERQRREVAVLAALALHPNIIRWVQGKRSPWLGTCLSLSAGLGQAIVVRN